jgi:hypothetical protein
VQIDPANVHFLNDGKVARFVPKACHFDLARLAARFA